MHSILVPVDFSDASYSAFQYGIRLANQFFSQIRLLHISSMPVLEPFGISGGLKTYSQSRERLEWERVESKFQEWEERIPRDQRRNIEIATTQVFGQAEQEIIKFIQENPPSLLIMGTSQKNRLDGYLYGEVIKKILPDLNCPLLMVPENHAYQPIQNIGYGTTFDDQDHQVIEALMDFAFLSEANIHCVHVGRGEHKDRTSFSKGLQALRERFNRDVKFHTIQTPDPNSEKVVEELISYAHEESIQMMTLLKHNRGFWGRLFHNSVVERLRTYSPIPILVFNLGEESKNL